MSWENFWFHGGPGYDVYLGFVRMMFFVVLFVVARKALLLDYARLYSTVPTAYYPVSFYTWFPPSVPRAIAAHMRLLGWIWYGSIFLALSGFFFPLGNIVAAILTFLLIGFRKQFGKINHARNLLPLFALVLACAPADALTSYPLFEIVDADHGYFWPVQLGRVLVATVWFSAGIAKVRYGGHRWIFSDYLSKLLKLHVMDYYFVPPKAPFLARWLPQHPTLCLAAALGTHVIELGYPLALFDAHAALFLVPASLLLILGFALAQGPLFLPLFAISILVWLPYRLL